MAEAPSMTNMDMRLPLKRMTPMQTSTFHLSDEHRYLRDALKCVEVATSCHELPPEGHAFFALLREAAVYFSDELLSHMAQEERDIYTLLAPSNPAGFDALRSEHRLIGVLAGEFYERVMFLPKEADRYAWQSLKAIARSLEDVLHAHLEHEETLVKKATRAQTAS
jgi:iron-sulfur cluster repair protein YtfE (RIC family)